MAVQLVNPNAEVIDKAAAAMMNINAARGLYDVLKTNLGPRGTLKMLVSGSGDIKLTKDGCVLLYEMQIQNPTAVMIARIATAQDEMTGDGTTSNVLIIGDLMKQSERLLSDGLHPRLITEGIEIAKSQVLDYLAKFKVELDVTKRETIFAVAQTSLRSKLHREMADKMCDVVCDAVMCVMTEDGSIDLHMIEKLHMQHKFETDTRLVKGLVMDHGCRHPDMPRRLEKVFVLTCNVDLEYTKSEHNSGFFYNNAEQRESMTIQERMVVDAKCQQIVDLKKKICTNGETFLIVNQKGIDPPSLDIFAKEGIMALRRAKRRNMERLVLACGGVALNSLDEMTVDDLGYAGLVYEQSLGDDKFTFVEDVRHPKSCTIMINGPHPHTIAQIKDAINDGLRAVRNCLQDKGLVPGAGAFEVAAWNYLSEYKKQVQGRAKMGVQAFADALLVIPKTLAENAGMDANDCIIKLQEEHQKGNVVGLDLNTGEPMDPAAAGVWDNYCVKLQMLDSSAVIATQLLLVDEVMKAGRQMKKNDMQG